ncbi:MAG: hypothetical protein V1672_01035 [Candidatus Diapherotrites archaeon]
MFGFLKGKIDVKLNKSNFRPGDMIQGTVTLDLKKSTNARGVFVKFYGMSKTTQHSGGVNLQPGSGVRISSGGFSIGSGSSRSSVGSSSRRSSVSHSSQSETITVYEFEQLVEGEKEYADGPQSYDFQIQIPSDLLDQNQAPNEMIGAIVQTAKFLSGSVTNVKWYINAKLDVPGGFDLSKQIQINITK